MVSASLSVSVVKIARTLSPAGVADQDGAAFGVAERAVPDRVAQGDLDGVGVAVAGQGDRSPVGVCGEVGGVAEPVSLEPGSAASAGVRRGGRVERGVDRQPGGDRGVLDQQGLAVVGGVPGSVQEAVRKCLGQK